MANFASSKQLGGLLLLTFLGVAVHGYHLGADDAAIYVPAIKRVADPSLYPFGSEFFMSHAHLSLFPDMVGQSSRFTHIPIDSVIFLWHLACVFLLLLAAWRLLDACFLSESARWSGVTLLAAVLSVPVAGTALALMDPYLTARSLSTPAILFAVAAYVAGKPWRAAAWLLLTSVVHPQMAMYGVVLLACVVFFAVRTAHAEFTPAACLLLMPALPLLFDLDPARGPAREALLSRTYFLVSNWMWYEWLGVFAPLALCWWFSRRETAGTKPAFQLLLRSLSPFGLLFTAAGLLLTSSSHLDNLTRLQPMRAFHLVYLIFFVFLGGVLGEHVLRHKTLRWIALFLPLISSMWLFQRNAYPASLHVEWPGANEVNSWNSAFYWIRYNVPKDAVFALDPGHMLRPGEDLHGFRAIAERSMLADSVKDSGAVSLFPNLAEHWKQQVEAQQGLEQFRPEQFRKLARLYPVTWIVTRQAAPAGFTCPYRNDGLSVCRINAGLSAGPTRAARLPQ
jgi:hypothetical protein